MAFYKKMDKEKSPFYINSLVLHVFNNLFGTFLAMLFWFLCSNDFEKDFLTDLEGYRGKSCISLWFSGQPAEESDDKRMCLSTTFLRLTFSLHVFFWLISVSVLRESTPFLIKICSLKQYLYSGMKIINSQH